jgi:hypothetical protein
MTTRDVMSQDYLKTLEKLGCEAPSKDADKNVDSIEKVIGVVLPDSYRRFLLECGGCWSDIFCPCAEPTPFGKDHGIAGFHDAKEVRNLVDSFITPRNMVTIATGHFAKYTCLSIAGIDRGWVYALDGEGRAWWSDETFEKRFNAMDGAIKEYLALRRQDQLPQKPAGYDHLYLLADNFDGFLSSCESSKTR